MPTPISWNQRRRIKPNPKDKTIDTTERMTETKTRPLSLTKEPAA